jgi:hypothetical protein
MGRKLDTTRGDGVEPDAQAEAGPNFISGRAADSQPDGNVTERLRWR